MATSLLLIRAALAYDAHGVALPPVTDSLDGQTVMPADGLSTGVVITAEYAREPLVLSVTELGEVRDSALLDTLFGLNLGASWRFNNGLGLGISVPMWPSATSSGVYAPDSGAALGDLRLWAPWNVWSAASGLQATVGGSLLLPTGDPSRYLGAGGVGGSLFGAVGLHRSQLHLGLDLALEAASTGSNDGASDGATVAIPASPTTARVGATAGVHVVGPLDLGAEAWLRAPLGEAEIGSPAEVLGSANLRLGRGWFLRMSGGRGLSDAPGAAATRAYFGLGFAPQRRGVPSTAAAPVAGPYDLLLQVTDANGAPLDATVRVEGPDGVRTFATPDGSARIGLGVGSFILTTTAPGLELQRRTLTMEAGRYRPASVDITLQPAGPGNNGLDLRIVEDDDTPLEGVEVRINGVTHGTTSIDGTLHIEPLPDGPVRVELSASNFQPFTAVELPTGTTEHLLSLARPPGAVKVVVRADGRVVEDAAVRFVGPETLPPEAVGSGGERVFVLKPGRWVATVSAPGFGVQQREIELSEAASTLQVVDVLLWPAEQGAAELEVRVVDPSGLPVEGAEVLLDGVRVGATANTGALALEGLEVGVRTLTVQGRRLRPLPPQEIELVDGRREVLVTVGWQPGSLLVVVRGPAGPVPDAMVRFRGPATLPPATLGQDGERQFQLDAGTWSVIVASPDLGVQERRVVVEPEQTRLLVIDAVLQPDEGGRSRLALTVRDPRGNPVDGASIQLDGAALGTTANGGTLILEGLDAGLRSLGIISPIYAEHYASLSLVAGDNNLERALGWRPGTVDLWIHDGADQPVPSAMARFSGARALPPVQPDSGGRALFPLEEGDWRLVVSAPDYRLHAVPLTVEGWPTPREVEVALSPEVVEGAELSLRLLDPDGQPVPNATVTLNDERRSLGAGGATVFSDLPTDGLKLSVQAPGFASFTENNLHLADGAQERRFVLQWVPRPVAITVRTDDGAAVDAQVRFVGPAPFTPLQTGADGDAQLAIRPGAWQVVVTAPGLGAANYDLTLLPGDSVERVDIVLSTPKVTVTSKAVEISQQVRFGFDDATLTPESYPVLEEVAAVLLLNPSILRIEIQGHTDAVGNDSYNLALSDARARAVRDYLISRGVAPERLLARGYGTSVPLAPNTTEAGRTRNRRVQFMIVEQEGPK